MGSRNSSDECVEMKLSRAFLALLFGLSLAGCDQVIDTQPYLIGTFVGTYYPGNPEDYINDVNPPMPPITTESRLVSTTSTRYDFEGTVSLDGEVYAITGYEESKYGDLAYLKPQIRGVFGDYLIKLTNNPGVTYTICGSTTYGSAGYRVYPEEPRAYGAVIISGAVASWEDCLYPEGDTILGTIDELEKR